MAKGVLGNDPFLRGAPARPETAVEKLPRVEPATTPAEAAPATAKIARTPVSSPAPPKEWPTAGRGKKPARSTVRVLMSAVSALRSEPLAEGAEPPATMGDAVLLEPPGRLGEWVPTSHADAPELLSLLQRANAGGQPREFVPHPNAPDLTAVLGASVTPHHNSPDLEAVLSPPATAHRSAPTVLADLRKETAISHPLSPDAVELPFSSPRPTVAVEIVEDTEPEPPMTDRDISTDRPARGPMVALGVAREIFSGGIARPLAGAARGLFQVARTALGVGGGTELDVWGKDLSLARTLEPLSNFLYERYFRVTVDGADHVPAGACLLIGNHSGALPLDGPMLYLALRRERADLPETRWLIEDQVFHAPFIGVLVNRLGAVRANPENATRLLEEKRPVAVFPEGIHGMSKRFSERYQLKRFGRGGYVKLAVRHNIPIVPVAIVGAEESMPLLARLPGGIFGLPYLPITPLPLPARWQIRFGPPLDLSDAPRNAEEDLAWVARTNDRTRQTVEGMLTSMLRARTSVF